MHARRTPLQLAERRVEAHHALRDGRRIVRELNQLGPAYPQVREHRVGEDFDELVGARRIAGFRRERFHVDVERFGEPQQDAGRDRPLIAFEVIEV